MAYASALGGGYGAGPTVISNGASHTDHIDVADAQLLFTADFTRAGPDLVLTGHDGRHHIIPGYFAAEQRPALVAPNGASLSADLIELLAGPRAPGQYAQAQPTAPAAGIGRVEKAVGNVTVMRNGVAVALHVGDAVYKNDVVQTGADSSCGIGFPDGTALNLVANTRMALNDYVYDPNGTSNDALFSLVQGGFAFVAGKVAHTGDMKINTPVATMGIRGTAPRVVIGDDGSVRFSTLVEDYLRNAPEKPGVPGQPGKPRLPGKRALPANQRERQARNEAVDAAIERAIAEQNKALETKLGICRGC